MEPGRKLKLRPRPLVHVFPLSYKKGLETIFTQDNMEYVEFQPYMKSWKEFP